MHFFKSLIQHSELGMICITNIAAQGFPSWGFSPYCSEFATFAKTVAIRGNFDAGIWNVENTETTA